MAALMGILLALRALQRNVLRSTLTITGLAIGVAAVVIVSGLSNGARAFVGARLKSVGTNMVIISPAPGTSHRKAALLTEEDARAIGREVPTVRGVAPVLLSGVELGNSEKKYTAALFATTLPFFEMKDWSTIQGDLWTHTEEITKAKVCVLGVGTARQIFGGEDPVGKIVRIGKHPYRVLGVLAPKGRDPAGNDQDARVIVPIGSARLRLLPDQKGHSVSMIIAASSSAAASARSMKQIEQLLRQRHHTVGKSEYFIRSQARLLMIQKTAFDALTAFFVCVAGMSLLVGGIGIMNIMLVSVTERTREIGIRLAVGASQANVLSQFLLEAATLSAIGGVLGIVVGQLALAVLQRILHWDMPVSPVAMIAAVVVSAVTGIVFGFAPAHRASRLDPIEALRRE